MRPLVFALVLLGCSSTPSAPADAPATDVPAAVSCETRAVTCNTPEPTCSPGTLPEVVRGCWGDCIAQAMCGVIRCDPRATGRAQCPRNWGCINKGECRPPR